MVRTFSNICSRNGLHSVVLVSQPELKEKTCIRPVKVAILKGEGCSYQVKLVTKFFIFDPFFQLGKLFLTWSRNFFRRLFFQLGNQLDNDFFSMCDFVNLVTLPVTW